MLPKLKNKALEGAIDWIERFIAQTERGGTVEATVAEPAQTSLVGSVEIGMTSIWYGADAPDGWLKLDGSFQYIDAHPELFEVFGYTFAPTPPAGLFKLPPAPSAISNGFWIIRG